MVDAGTALAVMGNHELNAIAWHTPDPISPGEYLRPRYREPWGAKNRKQHAAFLAQVEHRPELHKDIVDWFLTLPLWLDLPHLRVVHACWHQPHIDWLSPRLVAGRYLSAELMPVATQETDGELRRDQAPQASFFEAVEVITKGIEVPLPPPHSFLDKDKIRRDRVRLRWWDVESTTYRDLALMPGHDEPGLPDIEVPPHWRLGSQGDKPTFFGHYWMKGAPNLQSATSVCVDYSAVAGGPLMAYRFEAGRPLDERDFMWVTEAS
jgi:hypothetical protein